MNRTESLVGRTVARRSKELWGRLFRRHTAAASAEEAELACRASGCHEHGVPDGPVGHESASHPAEHETRYIEEIVLEVLAELPPVCRAALILHRRDDLSYEQIGQRLGISSALVRQHIATGLRQCCIRLQSLG